MTSCHDTHEMVQTRQSNMACGVQNKYITETEKQRLDLHQWKNESGLSVECRVSVSVLIMLQYYAVSVEHRSAVVATKWQ